MTDVDAKVAVLQRLAHAAYDDAVGAEVSLVVADDGYRVEVHALMVSGRVKMVATRDPSILAAAVDEAMRFVGAAVRARMERHAQRYQRVNASLLEVLEAWRAVST